jgi:hypothetical protein
MSEHRGWSGNRLAVPLGSYKPGAPNFLRCHGRSRDAGCRGKSLAIGAGRGCFVGPANPSMTHPAARAAGHGGAQISVDPRKEDQRCNGDGAGLRTGATAGCGEGIVARMSCSAASSLAAKSRAICSWPTTIWAASWSTFWRTAARSADIALSSWGSGEDSVGAIVSGAVWATATCGANQLSCGYEFAIIPLAASP